MTTKIIIEPILLDDVNALNRIRYNTNNHWDSEKGKPEDYDTVLSQGNTCNWIDLFHQNYQTLTLKKKDLKWIYEAFRSGQFTLHP